MKAIDELKNTMLDKPVEVLLISLPLAICYNANPSKKYCFSLFRHDDGEWIATYEVYGEDVLAQTNSYDLKTCLVNLYCQIFRREDLFFINQ